MERRAILSYERNTLDLIGLIYEAAADPGLWPVFLERLSRTLHTMANNLFLQDFAGVGENSGTTLGSVGLDPAYYRSYMEHYGAKNPALQSLPLLQPGGVYRHQELYPNEALYRTEFWNDWATPQNMGHAVFGMVLREDAFAGMLNIVRQRHVAPFSAKDIQFIRGLMPHLQRAMQLHLRIAKLESKRNGATDALNRWSMGVILLDGEGQVILMNRMAEAILNQKDGLIFDRHGLRAARSSETTALRRLIQGAFRKNGTTRPGGTIAITRPSFKRPLSVLVTPSCSNDYLFPYKRAAAALFVSDPERAGESQPELLARLYGLTPAEARVASLLLEGLLLPAIADEFAISLNTAKTHAKRVYEKTTTRGQADLIQSVMHGPACLFGQKQFAPHHPIG
jgi:DNA-binding CsgD family transcriptional regulator/PAS domain-containing protein